MPKLIDLVGQTFGTARVISKNSSRNGKVYWLCECIICGKQKVIQGSHLKTGSAKSCGCNCNFDNNILDKNRKCEICGNSFVIMNNAWTRKYCYKCSPHEDENMSHAMAITIRRKAIKKALVLYKGGECKRCGYNKCLSALEFHHLDPEEKDFGLSENLTKDFNLLKKEADKCILVCSNCHKEIHEELNEDIKILEED